MDAPERIWLLPHDGEQRCWCDDPAPGLDMNPSEADEYVRADALAAKDAEIERLGSELRVAQERYAVCCDKRSRLREALGKIVWLHTPDEVSHKIARKALEG